MSAATGYGKEPEPSTSSSVQLPQQCRHFQLSDILLATENFDESLLIGRGGFGKVYKGTIFNGSATALAAIKRLDRSSNQGAPEFWAEVEMLSKLRHCNLVSLFGYCNDEEEMILVYEYMPNGTLDDHLHKLGTPLSWVQRLKICIGAGRGLHYLHTGTGIDVGVIHRDVKTSNILLHESWAAKISDFGLSKMGPTNQTMTHVNTLVRGTFGYFDPDYYATGKLTRKSDVYAFGVVLLEVLCRKRAIFNINGEASNLANWAQESIKEGSLKNIIDFDIRGQVSPKCSKEFLRIAERCLHSSPKNRSTMAEVLSSLESILSLQEKFNNSVQPAGRTILDRMVNMLPFPSNGENTGNITRNASTGEGVSGKVLSRPKAASPDPGKGKSKSSHNKVFHGFHLLEGKFGHDMEDYHVAEYRTINGHVLGLFAIFDGHLGDRVPSFLKDNLFNNILGEPSFWKDPERAIRYAYASTDKFILENAMQLGLGGSTAVTAIVVDGRDIWVANIGDSRAVLCERGSANQLTVDHTPLEERSRIEKQGGFVTKLPGDVPRVNGQLAVARAFGHQSLKAHLSSEPDIRHVPIDASIELMILASDGLWEVMSNHEAIEMVKSIKDPLAAAKRLTSEALARQSKDDISCIVIRFG